MSETVDVLFVNPGDRKQVYQDLGDEFSAIEPPVFSGLFASYLRGKGYRAAIYDVPAMGVTAEYAAQVAAEEYKAQLIVMPVYGFQPSASTQNMSSAGKIARLIKEAGCATPILMTGTHPASLPKRTMEEEATDFVCDLEGPITIRRTLEALKAGSTDFGLIPSLWWRQGGTVMAPKSAEPLIQDLDGEMPGVAWDLLPMSRYRAHNWHCFDNINQRTPYASIHTTLGCPYHCSFCCINAPFGKPAYRMWSPKRVVEEIDHLVETYGVKNIKFVDEMFVLNRRHVSGICDLLIDRGHNLNIWAYARVDTVYEDLLGKLKAAGVNWLALGIESASEYVRDGASKKLKTNDIVDVVRRIQDAGIRVIGNFIFGLPDDSVERMQQTLDLAQELNCEFANFYSAMAYPGSQLYKYAVEKGIQLPAQWHHYSQHAYEATPLANEHCTAGEILAMRDKAFQSYFSNPAYLEMVKRKFGNDVVEHLKRMTAMPLKRKLTSSERAA